MSVEAAPTPSEASIPSEPTNDSPESEIVALLKEENALLRELLATTRSGSAALDPMWAKVQEIAQAVEPTEDVHFVAVDPTTGEYATGRTSREASDALGTPAERNYVTGAGGKPTRAGTWRPGSR